MKIKAVLTQTEVSLMLGAARDEAQANGWAVAIAVVDDGGHLLAFERLDDASPISSYISIEKPVPRHSANVSPKVTKKWSTAGVRHFSAPRC